MQSLTTLIASNFVRITSSSMLSIAPADDSTKASLSAQRPSTSPSWYNFTSKLIVSFDPGSMDSIAPQQCSTSSIMLVTDGLSVVETTAPPLDVALLFGFFLDAGPGAD